MNMNLRVQGVALITVLLVLGLASLAVLSMSTARQADIRRTDNQLLASQRWEMVLALEQQAIALLSKKTADVRWQGLTLTIEAAGMTAVAEIEDLQGRINLNNLIRDNEVSDRDVDRLRRLLLTQKQPPVLVDAIIDWIDANMEIRYPDGAEDETYSRRKPPYRTANRSFADIRELLLVDGMDREIFQALRPFIYVADGYAPLNVNRASTEVLRCLADDISKDRAASMFRAHGKPFEKVEEFLKDEAVVDAKVDKYGLSVTSEHFQLQGEIQGKGGNFRFVSRLARQGEGKPQVLRRQRVGMVDG